MNHLFDTDTVSIKFNIPTEHSLIYHPENIVLPDPLMQGRKALSEVYGIFCAIADICNAKETKDPYTKEKPIIGGNNDSWKDDIYKQDFSSGEEKLFLAGVIQGYRDLAIACLQMLPENKKDELKKILAKLDDLKAGQNEMQNLLYSGNADARRMIVNKDRELEDLLKDKKLVSIYYKIYKGCTKAELAEEYNKSLAWAQCQRRNINSALKAANRPDLSLPDFERPQKRNSKKRNSKV